MSAQQAGSALQMQGRRVMNLAHFVTQAARRHPNGLALVWGELQWTWRESEARIASLVAGLASLGIGHGDRVLVHSKNTNELFVAMFTPPPGYEQIEAHRNKARMMGVF